MTNKTKVTTPHEELETFMKDLVSLRKLLEKEFSKISKSKYALEECTTEDGVFNTTKGEVLAKDYTNTFKAFVNAARNLDKNLTKEREEADLFFKNNLDFLEQYEKIFKIHNEVELLQKFLHK